MQCAGNIVLVDSVEFCRKISDCSYLFVWDVIDIRDKSLIRFTI